MILSSGAAAGSYVTRLAKEQGLQGRVMWFDADANLWQLSTRRGVAETVAKCKAANINTLVVDVKPLSGLVLYDSRIAPRLRTVRGRRYPPNYDLLRTVIEEGHRAGLKVHAAINVFSEGSQTSDAGPAHLHPDWQCVKYEMVRFVSVESGDTLELKCASGPASEGGVCAYGPGEEWTGELPPDTAYVRVSASGDPLQRGFASGKARLSAPEGGYLVVATGSQAARLRQMAESGARFEIRGKGVLMRVGAGGNAQNAIFVNPLHPEARAYALNVVKEICSRYPVDGLVLDRMRYPNIYTDFSDLTRKAFERYIGRPVARWPEDVFTRDVMPGDDVIRGPLFKSWLKFRAQVMRDFLSEARSVVKSANPRVLLGIYVGSWYPLYYDVGVNWGSPRYAAELEWWPEGYEQTGYANLVDYMCTGCYYAHPTRADAIAAGEEEWKSVEAAAEESMNAVQGATFVYGSLYLQQYSGRPQKFMEAVRQCLDKTDGCMFFDLVYVRDYEWWDLLKQAFPAPAKAPHDVPGLLGRLRGESPAYSE